jgi:hypothetical protein
MFGILVLAEFFLQTYLKKQKLIVDLGVRVGMMDMAKNSGFLQNDSLVPIHELYCLRMNNQGTTMQCLRKAILMMILIKIQQKGISHEICLRLFV